MPSGNIQEFKTQFHLKRFYYLKMLECRIFHYVNNNNNNYDDDNNNKHFMCKTTLHVVEIVNTKQLHHSIP